MAHSYGGVSLFPFKQLKTLLPCSSTSLHTNDNNCACVGTCGNCSVFWGGGYSGTCAPRARKCVLLVRAVREQTLASDKCVCVRACAHACRCVGVFRVSQSVSCTSVESEGDQTVSQLP